MLQKLSLLFSKKYEKITHMVFIGVLFFGIVSSVLFYVQYYRFKKISLELLDIKEDYRVYTNALKKILNDKAYDIEQIAESDQKKKVINSPFDGIDSVDIISSEDSLEDHFFLINRDEEYLEKRAFKFARKHGLYDEVSKVMDIQEWEKAVMPRIKYTKKKVVPRKKNKGAEFVGIPAGKGILKLGQKKGAYDFDFSWPIDRKKFWLSSLFGPRRLKNRGWKYHYGIDMAALKGTPVKAAATGIVLESYWNNGYGNCIIVAHNKKYKTRYAHLDKRLVRVGQKVKRGEVIGKVGDTGLVRKSGKDASHLHFEVYAFGKHVNPLSVLI